MQYPRTDAPVLDIHDQSRQITEVLLCYAVSLVCQDNITILTLDDTTSKVCFMHQWRFMLF
jgi:hypothetical protein